MPCGVRTFLTAASDEGRDGGAKARSAHHGLVPCGMGKGPNLGRAGGHAKKRSGLNRRLRFYRSSFCFISSTVSL